MTKIPIRIKLCLQATADGPILQPKSTGQR